MDLLAEVYTAEQGGAVGFGLAKSLLVKKWCGANSQRCPRPWLVAAPLAPDSLFRCRAWWSQKAGQEPSFGLKREDCLAQLP